MAISCRSNLRLFLKHKVK
ncbi:putative rTX toxin, partial [Vibrio parahaemolyticus EKP-008]